MSLAYKEITRRLEQDTPFYARNVLKIVDKRRQMVSLDANAGQLVLDAKLAAQADASAPERAIALKARKVGVSTWMQGKMIQRATQRANYDVIVLAHDLKTGNELFRIGKRMYDNLPPDPAVKPDLGGTRRGREMHFLNGGVRNRGPAAFPDSTYLVDTATEKESGRGLTPMGVHGSETAFWPDLGTKLAALENAVPDEPGSLIVLESTANGSNEFKDLWDDTVAGRNAYAAFFWPWWKEADYSRPFANDDERERFRPGDTHQFAHAADEPALLDPGPLDIDTNEHVPLTLEQLNWRRFKIGSKPLHIFNQEFPATPEDAFVASGRKVFDPAHVKRVFIATALTDPLNPTAEHPGPEVGKLIVKKKATRPMPNGDELVVPTEAGWLPASKLELGETADWRIYEQPKEGEQYVAGVDVSGGEIAGERGEPAYHAIEIIHHKTRVQVAEYRSRLDPDLLAEQVLLGALLYNEPWLAIEITGSWGAPIARKLWFAYHYKFMYFRQKHDRKVERSEDRLGWNTGRDTKPILEANTTELLREESHGIRSRGLAEELATYVRLPSGKSEPEPGKYADRLMAWQIAQQVALEKPVKRDFGSQPARPVRNRVTGW